MRELGKTKNWILLSSGAMAGWWSVNHTTREVQRVMDLLPDDDPGQDTPQHTILRAEMGRAYPNKKVKRFTEEEGMPSRPNYFAVYKHKVRSPSFGSGQK